MAVFQATLNNNARAGYLIGFGAILAEIIYCAIPMFSLGETLKRLGNHVDTLHPFYPGFADHGHCHHRQSQQGRSK